MSLGDTVSSYARRIAGDGWMYRTPWYYQRLIHKTFGLARTQASLYLLGRIDEPARIRRVLDVACGTGITTVWLASAFPTANVLGIDSSSKMLRYATRRARAEGVQGRCTFVSSNAAVLDLRDMRQEPFDLMTCFLGYSVIDQWRDAYRNTVGLLGPDGIYAIFDQFGEGLFAPDFAADQTRKSWELIEQSFERCDTKWYGNCFIAIGTGRKSTAEPGDRACATR